ncbi:hypothetical protein [Fibrobacter sp. UBA4309]|uniref:hypothetical protein n=1 Tax=Fibrobacter sp. UBA4309 TaxID=1946537 RepID=UPI0025C6068C|nr:hypothetical protein [Fibrobacter sp. UBA4309]
MMFRVLLEACLRGWKAYPTTFWRFIPILPQCGEFRPEGSCNSITGADGKEYRFECVGTKWEYNQDCEEPKCLTATSRIEHPECELQECNAEIEGLVEHMTPGYHPAYQSNVEYHRCEQGEWLQVEASAACDTAGVSVGDVCDMRIAYAGAKSGHDSFNCYKYLGDGAWKTIAIAVRAGETCFAVQGDLPPDIAGWYYSFYHEADCDETSDLPIQSDDGTWYLLQCVEAKWEISEYQECNDGNDSCLAVQEGESAPSDSTDEQ